MPAADDAGLILLIHHGETEWVFDAQYTRRRASGFAVHMSRDKGSCAFATRDFAVGETLLAELPLFRWPREEPMTRENLEPVLLRILRHLTPWRVAAYTSLSQASIHASGQWRQQTPTGIWLTNALPSGAGGEAACYEDACRINHACCPNLCHDFDEKTGTQTMFAVQPIKAGEELTIDYCGQAAPRHMRQAALATTFGFECACTLCSLESSALGLSDMRQTKLAELRALIGSGQLEGTELVTAIEERGLLLRREGLPAPWAQPELLVAFQHFETRGEYRQAAKWARRAAECARVALGATSQRSRQLAELTALMEKKAGIDSQTYTF